MTECVGDSSLQTSDGKVAGMELCASIREGLGRLFKDWILLELCKRDERERPAGGQATRKRFELPKCVNI